MQKIQKYIGNYGKYQIYIFIICSLPVFLNGCFKMLSTFTAGVPNTRCFIPGFDTESTIYETPFIYNQNAYLLSNMSVVFDAHIYCSYCDPTNLVKRVSCESSSSRKCLNYVYDTKMFKSTIVFMFNMVCDDVWMNQFLVSMFMVGGFIGGLTIGNLGDRYGRRKTFIITGAIQMILTNIIPFATNFYIYCIFQILLGATQAGTYLTSFIIIMELFDGMAKTVFGLQAQSILALGYIYVGIMAYVIRDWKYLTLSVSLWTVFYIPLFWLFPESIRWLVFNGKIEEARKLVKIVAKMNKVMIPDEVLQKLSVNERVYRASIFDLFKNGRMAFVTLILFFTWICCSISSYGLSLSTSILPGNIYVNFIISAIIEIITHIICIPFMEYAGRRWSMVGFMFIGGTSCILSCLFNKKYLVLVLIFMGKFCFSSAFAIIYNHTAEIFPTCLRNTGLGVCSSMSRIGSIVAPQVVLLADYFGAWIPIMIFGSLGVLASFFDIFLPETKGHQSVETLEEGIDFLKDIEERMPIVQH